LFKVKSNNINAVLAFIENKTVCRNRVILNYFNEKSEVNCGSCDVCRDATKTKKPQLKIPDVKSAIINLLQSTPANLNQIKENLNYDAATLSNTLELMLDNKEVVRDKQFNFTLKDA